MAIVAALDNPCDFARPLGAGSLLAEGMAVVICDWVLVLVVVVAVEPVIELPKADVSETKSEACHAICTLYAFKPPSESNKTLVVYGIPPVATTLTYPCDASVPRFIVHPRDSYQLLYELDSAAETELHEKLEKLKDSMPSARGQHWARVSVTAPRVTSD